MHTRTPRIVAAVAAAVLVLVSPGPAQARATDPPVTVTAARTLTVTGHGWGHGHGMSQYGAQGAAKQGLRFDQILAFYYPGTQLASTSGKVRVRITADTDGNTTVRHRSGLRVLDTGNGTTYQLRTKRTPKVWRLRSVQGQTRLYYRTDKWHLYRTGGRVALKGAGEFRASGPLTLRLPSGDRAYRGGLRFVGGSTVNVLSVEKYLRGVVPSEMPPSWAPAALQAQAVAARTYAVRERADNARRSYDLCDTSSCQVYKGVANEWTSTSAAIAATASQVLTYQGTPAFAQFSSSSGGWTSTGSQPYLQAHEDPYTTAASDPNATWTKTVNVAALEKARPKVGTLTSVQVLDRDGDATHPDDGWVLTITLVGAKGTDTISGSEFKSLYGLKSAYFTLSVP